MVSEEDRDRWDRRHEASGPADLVQGPPIFGSFQEWFPISGLALEIACGRGETAVWLALRGMEVQAADVSPVAIGLARDLAARNGVTDRCRFEVWDLDEGLPVGPQVDLMVCHMYHQPRLYRAMEERLAPGGLLAIAGLSEVGSEVGRFRARPGELRAAFEELELVGEDEGNGVAWLLGRKSG